MSEHTHEIGRSEIINTIDSAQLFNGARELAVRHGDQLYRLKITKQDKLILTK